MGLNNDSEGSGAQRRFTEGEGHCYRNAVSRKTSPGPEGYIAERYIKINVPLGQVRALYIPLYVRPVGQALRGRCKFTYSSKIRPRPTTLHGQVLI